MASTDGLPDVDLGPILDDLKSGQDKGKEVAPEEKKTGELAQFKDPDALLKGYKELQGFATKVSQENKEKEKRLAELQEKLADLEETVRLVPHNTPVNPQGQQFEDIYYDNPKAAINQVVQEAVATQRIADALEAEAEVNPTEFQERYAWAQQVAQQHPHLAKTPSGVRKLFREGDKLRKERLKAGASNALELIFGEPLNEEEIEKLRKMVKGDKQIKQTNTNNNAYMPDISTTTRSGSDAEHKPNPKAKIEAAVKAKDVDGVLQGLFDQAMGR